MEVLITTIQLIYTGYIILFCAWCVGKIRSKWNYKKDVQDLKK